MASEGHITERADAFAKRLIHKPPEDTRTDDEKMAGFHKKWTSRERLRNAHQRAKKVKERTSAY